MNNKKFYTALIPFVICIVVSLAVHSFNHLFWLFAAVGGAVSLVIFAYYMDTDKEIDNML